MEKEVSSNFSQYELLGWITLFDGIDQVMARLRFYIEEEDYFPTTFCSDVSRLICERNFLQQTDFSVESGRLQHWLGEDELIYVEMTSSVVVYHLKIYYDNFNCSYKTWHSATNFMMHFLWKIVKTNNWRATASVQII